MSDFWGAETKPVSESGGFWGEDAKPAEDISVKFAPSTATEEELRQAAIGGNRPAMDEFHKRHLAESNPTLGAATDELVSKATDALVHTPESIVRSIPGILHAAGSPLEAYHLVKDMIGKVGTDLGNISAIVPGIPGTGLLGPPGSTGMPLSQYGKAGTAIGENVGMVAAPELARIGVGAAAKVPGKAVEVVQGAAEKGASRAINSLIKTQPKEFRFGRNPGLEVARQNLTSASREGLLEKINTRANEIHQGVQVNLEAPENASKTIDIQPAVDVVDEAINEAKSSGEQTLFDRLNTLKKQITHKGFDPDESGKLQPIGEPSTILNPVDTNALKMKIGKQTKWTGQPFDDDLNKVKVGVYGTLNDLVDNAVPGTKAENSQVANLIGAAKSAEREVIKGQARNITGHILARGASGVIGSVIGGTAGGFHGAGYGALAGMAAEKFLGSPLSKTVIASRLAKIAGPRAEIPVKAYPESIGNVGTESTKTTLSGLPVGAYSAFGQKAGLIAETLGKDPAPSEAVVKSIKRAAETYLSDWEDIQLQNKRIVYTKEGEQGRITGRFAEQESGFHPSEIPGIADARAMPIEITQALKKKIGPVYRRLKLQAEKLATEDHLARQLLDEPTKERIAEAAGSDEMAFRKLLKDEVTAKLSGVNQEETLP